MDKRKKDFNDFNKTPFQITNRFQIILKNNKKYLTLVNGR